MRYRNDYRREKTFKRGQMENGDANSGLSWTVIYEVAKPIFLKVLSFRFHSCCPLFNTFFSLRIKHYISCILCVVYIPDITCTQKCSAYNQYNSYTP